MPDDQLMELALDEARQAAEHGAVPVGAVVVHEGEVIARAHNRREVDSDPTAHAEVLALRAAADRLGTWRLEGCTVVVTLEPCIMCAGALLSARVDAVVFAAHDPKAGATGSLYNVADDPRLNHRFALRHGVRADEAAELLTTFFASRR